MDKMLSKSLGVLDAHGYIVQSYAVNAFKNVESEVFNKLTKGSFNGYFFESMCRHNHYACTKFDSLKAIEGFFFIAEHRRQCIACLYGAGISGACIFFSI